MLNSSVGSLEPPYERLDIVENGAVLAEERGERIGQPKLLSRGRDPLLEASPQALQQRTTCHTSGPVSNAARRPAGPSRKTIPG